MTLKEAGLLYPTILQCVYIAAHNLPYVNFVVKMNQENYIFTYK